MRVPLSWLKDFVDLTIPLDDLTHRLIMAGLEVASVEQIGATWQPDKLFVGEVLEVRPHPNAERLVLAVVEYGQGTPQIVVTGAPNLRPGERGQKVAFAVEGAELLDGHSDTPRMQRLRRTTIRGVESAGMVCSEKELGLSDDHDGVIMLDASAPVGRPLREVLGDTVLEVELTPNLAYANSVVGLAREIAALTGQQMRPWRPQDSRLTQTHGASTSYVMVRSADTQLCPRYSAALIENVTIQASPSWLQRRLSLAGMRPINNIVDITNYCMLELGQPLHAFDYETLRLHHGIVVRQALPGERLTTLDGVERSLTEPMLLITDDSGPIALAGVMGGGHTEVTAGTRHILLEAANFDAITIRRTSQALRLVSEAGQRFGRGLDSHLTLPTLLRAGRLMEEVGGGRMHPDIADTYPHPPSPRRITLRSTEVRRTLGMDFSLETMSRILSALEFQCTAHCSDGDARLEVDVPSHRLDVSIPADLLEDIARIHGYEAIPLTLMHDVLPPQRSQPVLAGIERTRDILVGCGLTEIIAYGLTSLDSVNRALIASPPVDATGYIRLANPISQERELLRQTLLPSMLETLRTNSRYRQRMALFEIGRVYLPEADEDLPREQRHLAIALTGAVLPASWHDAAEAPGFGFLHLKGILETLCQRLAVPDLRLLPGNHPTLHPTRAAVLQVAGQQLGIIGEAHPQVCERFDLPDQPVAVLELHLDLLLAQRQPQRYQRIARFPAVLEDMALVVDADLPAQTVEETIRAAGGSLLRQVTLFDLYQGEQIAAGKKSLAYALTFQAEDRSLTEDEVLQLYQQIQQHAATTLGAEARR
ncbi:MAG: phenylalanine--tRNA ligase subunit beta [Candidatus Tectimicrobiota bacterium]